MFWPKKRAKGEVSDRVSGKINRKKAQNFANRNCFFTPYKGFSRTPPPLQGGGSFIFASLRLLPRKIPNPRNRFSSVMSKISFRSKIQGQKLAKTPRGSPLDFLTPKNRYPLFGTNIDGTENWVPSLTVPRFGYRQKRYPKPGTVNHGTQFRVPYMMVPNTVPQVFSPKNVFQLGLYFKKTLL